MVVEDCNGKNLRKARLVGSGLAQEDNTELVYKYVGCDDVEWIDLAANRNQ